VGSNIQYSYPPLYGVIKWIGKLHSETEIYVGTEMVRHEVANYSVS